MFFILFCTYIRCSSVDDYNNLFASFRIQLSEEQNSFFEKPQPISNRADLSSKSKVYITYTLFKGCSISNNQGGAIYYSNSGGKILIEFSTFSQCNASSSGALRINNCDCVIYCVCSNNCCSNSVGQFIYSTLNNKGKLNFINYSSICATNNNRYSDTLDMYYGKQICTKGNISYNNLNRFSGIYFGSGSDSSYITYCSINSNTATESCIGLSSFGINYNIDTCNIINNKINRRTIWADRPTTIQNCCIFNNTNSPLFYSMINIYSYLSIHSSCVDVSLSGISTDNVTTDSNKFYLNYLKFTSTEKYCNSGFGELKKTYDNKNFMYIIRNSTKLYTFLLNLFIL